MFVVRPIQIKSEQCEICKALGVPFFENAIAFYAADLKDDNTTVDSYISICQFYFKGDAEIVSFAAADGREEDEAVIIMLRAAMSFMHRCGVNFAFFAQEAASEHWLKKSGFRYREGFWSIDLDKFYSAPCKYSDGD